MAIPVATLSSELIAAVDAAAPSVVHVVGRHGIGTSGFALEARRIVASRAAISREGPVALRTAAGDRLEARLVGRDAGTDLALLAVNVDLAPLPLREEPAQVGELALALGRPGRGIRASLRMVGVVGPELGTPRGGRLEPYIETDRGLPRGFAGGPLIDVTGAGLGMGTRAVFDGADLAVPPATLRRVAAVLEQHGGVPRGFLGVVVQPVSLPRAIAATLGRERGALIAAVEEGGPADAAGLLVGDILVELGGEPITGPVSLRELLLAQPGVTLHGVRVRGGAAEQLDVAVGTRG